LIAVSVWITWVDLEGRWRVYPPLQRGHDSRRHGLVEAERVAIAITGSPTRALLESPSVSGCKRHDLGRP